MLNSNVLIQSHTFVHNFSSVIQVTGLNLMRGICCLKRFHQLISYSRTNRQHRYHPRGGASVTKASKALSTVNGLWACAVIVTAADRSTIVAKTLDLLTGDSFLFNDRALGHYPENSSSSKFHASTSAAWELRPINSRFEFIHSLMLSGCVVRLNERPLSTFVQKIQE